MITLERRRILVDGLPRLVMAGEVHYFRVERGQWPDRLDKLKEVGCTCVASYIPWLFHELPDGSVDLTGRTRPERDLGAFLDLAAERGLTFLARPGPFVMAELKNEGIPYRIYREHPEVVPLGWDGAPAATRTVDYLAPAFLSEVDRWYAGVMPVLARRLQPRGGNVIAVQLDNEIGMLAWVSNSPDLTDGLLQDFLLWCQERYGERVDDRYPPVTGGAPAWADAVRSPTERWAAALRVDLGLFMRRRFARYVEWLADSARRYGIVDVPFLVNIHGTEGPNGVPFGIGVSQLFESYAGIHGFAAGSDHYLGDMTLSATVDLHFINAAMAAVNAADQPLTSLELEAGTGDYGGGLEQLYDASTVDLKTRLCVAQGCRLVNYYLLAGGVNPHLDEPVGDGNDRIAFTGEQHGIAAPIGPLGQRGLTFDATATVTQAMIANAAWLADMDEEHDDLAMGFWPDAFMTEYHHPQSAVMTDVVDDLTAFRGPGQRRSLWRSLLFAGHRFSAVNLQDPSTTLPRTIALSCGDVLDGSVQSRLAAHVRGGGSLLLMGRIPQRDQENLPCSVLGDALGLISGAITTSGRSLEPSVVGRHLAAGLPELRVSWLGEVVGHDAEPLLTDVAGTVCAVTLHVGDGRAAVICTDLPARPDLISKLTTWLGSPAELLLRTSVPGVVATTTAGPDGARMLHLLNSTGYPAVVQVDVGDPTGLLDQPLRLQAKTGVMLSLGLRLPAGATVVSANAEISAVTPDRVTFGPGLGDRTVVHLSGHAALDTQADVQAHGHITKVTGPAESPLVIRFV
jgi:beta-galactosidase